MILLSALATAQGQTNWTNPGTGDWFTDGNWSAGEPTAAVNATLDNGGTIQVAGPGAEARQIVIGNLVAESGSLQILAGGDLSMIDGTNEVVFGNAGQSNLLISGGGTLTSGFTIFGDLAGSLSDTLITGAGSEFTGLRATTLGYDGDAQLEINSGGKFIGTGSVSAGFQATGNADILVTGAGSELLVNASLDPMGASGFLTIGSAGTGTLTVENQGKAIANGGITVGSAATGDGEVTATGSGALVKVNTGTFTVGSAGLGVATFSGGADLEAVRGIIGSSFNTDLGDGTLTLTGDGTTATFAGANSYISVGQNGVGLMEVLAGADVTLGSRLTIGDSSSGDGELLIQGAGSTVTSSSDNEVAYSGTALLTIEQGGTLSGTLGYIAAQGSAEGTAVVRNAGSEWTLSSGLRVGDRGDGTLTIADGGLVSVASGAGTVNVARIAGSQGRLEIGSGGLAGVLEAASVVFGAGTGVVSFNHTDSVTFTPNISGTGTLEKLGTGTVELTGTSSFTGDFNVEAGRALLNGTTPNANIRVAAGATLGGDSTGAGTIYLYTDATLEPGEGTGVVGELLAAGLSWAAGAAMDFQLGATSDVPASDQLVLSGSLILDDSLLPQGPLEGEFVFNFSDGAGLATPGNTYDLILFTTLDGFTVDHFAYTYTGALPDLDGYFALQSDRLQFVVIPEPSAIWLLALAAACLSVRRRRSAL